MGNSTWGPYGCAQMGPRCIPVAKPTSVPYGLPIYDPYNYPSEAHMGFIFFACWVWPLQVIVQYCKN